MAKASQKTVRLTRLALLTALLAVLTFTPLGFIPLPVASVTIIHIPVIVAAILFGPLDGAFLGAMFGIFSMWKATIGPMAPTDLLFSPFSSGKPLETVLMALVPRLLFGLIGALLYRVLVKRMSGRLAAGAAAFVATLFHSLMVLSLLSMLFDGFPLSQLFGVVLSVNGIIEITLAIVLCVAVCPPLTKALHRIS